MKCEAIDRLTLLSYATGGLSTNRQQSVEEHLQNCAVCSWQLKTIHEEQAAFLREMPHRLSVCQPRPLLKVPYIFKRITALAASLLIVVGLSAVLRDTHLQGTRIKGGGQIRLYLAGDHGEVIHRESAVFFPGERIQFTYSCAKRSWIVLAGVEESGEVTIYFPAADSLSMMVEPGSNVPLPNSIELDTYTGVEQYVAVFTLQPIEVANVVAAIKKSPPESGVLRSVCRAYPKAVVSSLTIQKKAHP